MTGCGTCRPGQRPAGQVVVFLGVEGASTRVRNRRGRRPGCRNYRPGGMEPPGPGRALMYHDDPGSASPRQVADALLLEADARAGAGGQDPGPGPPRQEHLMAATRSRPAGSAASFGRAAARYSGCRVGGDGYRSRSGSPPQGPMLGFVALDPYPPAILVALLFKRPSGQVPA